MSIRFSIITINYNNAQGLNNTINSVVEQDYQNYEYIVIDGGSTDESIEIINRCKDNIDYSVSEKDNGVYHAMNKGIRAAKGDYIIFMNSGDSFYHVDTLSVYANNIEQDTGICYGHAACFNSAEGISSLIQPSQLNLSFWLFNGLNHQSTAIRRDLFDLYGLYNEESKITADWQFFVKAYLLYQVKFKYIDMMLCRYDMSGISSVPTMAQLHLDERENFIKNDLPQFWEEYLLLKKARNAASPTKREQHFYRIQKSPMAYRLLKTFMDILLIFIPKEKKK